MTRKKSEGETKEQGLSPDEEVVWQGPVYKKVVNRKRNRARFEKLVKESGSKVFHQGRRYKLVDHNWLEKDSQDRVVGVNCGVRPVDLDGRPILPEDDDPWYVDVDPATGVAYARERSTGAPLHVYAIGVERMAAIREYYKDRVSQMVAFNKLRIEGMVQEGLWQPWDALCCLFGNDSLAIEEPALVKFLERAHASGRLKLTFVESTRLADVLDVLRLVLQSDLVEHIHNRPITRAALRRIVDEGWRPNVVSCPETATASPAPVKKIRQVEMTIDKDDLVVDIEGERQVRFKMVMGKDGRRGRQAWALITLAKKHESGGATLKDLWGDVYGDVKDPGVVLKRLCALVTQIKDRLEKKHVVGLLPELVEKAIKRAQKDALGAQQRFYLNAITVIPPDDFREHDDFRTRAVPVNEECMPDYDPSQGPYRA